MCSLPSNQNLQVYASFVSHMFLCSFPDKGKVDKYREKQEKKCAKREDDEDSESHRKHKHRHHDHHHRHHHKRGHSKKDRKHRDSDHSDSDCSKHLESSTNVTKSNQDSKKRAHSRETDSGKLRDSDLEEKYKKDKRRKHEDSQKR